MDLLIVPLVLVVIGLVFTMLQDARQQDLENQRAEQAQKIENQRAEAERELAEQRAQDEALQAYLDQMSQLMLDRKLLEAEQGDPVHILAQARTSTIILRLDAEHNESVIRFLGDIVSRRSSEPHHHECYLVRIRVILPETYKTLLDFWRRLQGFQRNVQCGRSYVEGHDSIVFLIIRQVPSFMSYLRLNIGSSSEPMHRAEMRVLFLQLVQIENPLSPTWGDPRNGVYSQGLMCSC
jgi:hypothetical protein